MTITPNKKNVTDLDEIVKILNDSKKKQKKKDKHKKNNKKKNKKHNKNKSKKKKGNKKKKSKKKKEKQKTSSNDNTNKIIKLDKSFYGGTNFFDDIFESFKIKGNVNVDLNITDDLVSHVLSTASSAILKLITRK